MSDQTNELRREYVSALESYLDAGDETALNRAYELGRRAMVDGLGVLDMAVLHQAAVQALVVPGPGGTRAQLAAGAASFFHELLSPFEMSFRGYRSANQELQSLNELLQAQKAAIEEANRELESFSYSVSHDLRAPLRSIDGFGEILAAECGQRLGEAGQKHLQYIREAAQHMGRLIEDLLALARVTQAEMNRTDVDLSALAGRIIDRLRAAAPGRTVTVTIQENVTARGDAGLLAVVLENLLGNAWKFTGKLDHASISFGCEQRDGVPTYFVRDNGAGFDMAYVAKLFSAFQRLHATSDFEGTGIGLATVHRIVRRHGGRIWAEGQINAGATFCLTLADERA